MGHRLYVRVTDPLTGQAWQTGDSGPVVERPNRAATGALTIELVTELATGTTQDPGVSEALDPATNALLVEGQTLVVKGAATLEDPDELTDPALRYQWFRHRRTDDPQGAAIPGATGERYVLSDKDHERRISVRVGFSDDQGNAESVRSRRTPRRTQIEARLTVEARGLPRSHQGENFVFHLLFTGDVTLGSEALKQALQIRGGEIRRARRVYAQDGRREIVVKPNGAQDVHISLPAGEPCETGGQVTGVCSPEGQRLQEGLELRVPGAESLPDTVPWAPRQLEAESIPARRTVEVSWQPPVFDGGQRLGAYEVEWKPVSNEWASDGGTSYSVYRSPVRATFDVISEFTEETPARDTALLFGNSYDFRVRARNSLGAGPWSEEIEFSVPEEDEFADSVPTTVPSAPRELTSEFNSDSTELTLSWQKPADDGGGPVPTYLLEWKLDSARWDLADGYSHGFAVAPPTTGNPQQVFQLVSEIPAEAGVNDPYLRFDRTYDFRVGAENHLGFSEASDELEVTIPPETSGQQAANSPAAGEVAIAGIPRVGETLAVSSAISDADGATQAVYAYQWLADGAEIAGATGDTYTLTDSEQGKRISVRITFTDDADNEETLTSQATGVVAAPEPANSPATGQPSISGTAQVGETLTAGTTGITDADGLTNVSYAYQWLAGDAEIPGATSSSYTLTDSEEGKAVTVRVTFTDDADNDETLTSQATGVVVGAEPANSPATGQPAITGTAQVGETLTAGTTGIADADGLDNVSYSYRWLADGAEIAGATGITYTLTDSEEGKTIKVKVSFTDDADNAESLTSAATGAVAAAEPPSPPSPPPAPTNLTAEVTGDGHIKLSWTAPDDDSVTGYQVLRRRPRQGEDTLEVYVEDTGSAGTTWTDTDAPAGTLYVYRVRAINATGAGPQSNFVNVDHQP